LSNSTYCCNLVQFRGFAKSVILLGDNSTYCNFVHIQATGSSHAASESANNGSDVGHTNGDLHAANVDNNQVSDNNGDHASIM